MSMGPVDFCLVSFLNLFSELLKNSAVVAPESSLTATCPSCLHTCSVVVDGARPAATAPPSGPALALALSPALALKAASAPASGASLETAPASAAAATLGFGNGSPAFDRFHVRNEEEGGEGEGADNGGGGAGGRGNADTAVGAVAAGVSTFADVAAETLGSVGAGAVDGSGGATPAATQSMHFASPAFFLS